jgi:GT2 family glycosyltransferase/glycosyltransferase involved in cell wall biosynthesis
MSAPAVTIVIPVFNDAATLAACLRGVFTHTDYPDWEVLVVDDGSTDGSRQVLQAFKQVRFIKKSRGGVASALNAGFAAAPGRDIVRLHADVVIDTPGWLGRLVHAATSLPQAGVVGVRLVYPDGRIQSEGRTIISGLGMHPQHSVRRAFQPDGAPGKVQEVDTVPGALAYYRREVIDRLGGLDEIYAAAWMEDDDFCIGARHAGYKVYVHAGVTAVHVTRSQPPGLQAHVANSEAQLTHLTGAAKLRANRIQADYWEAKWGWHPCGPDLGEIRRLHGATEICWQIGESLRFQPSSETPTVDCCLVTWNTLPLLRRCLESLALTKYPADRLTVIIADNASTDGTPEYLAALAPTFPFAIRVVPLAVNTGAPVGLNFAITAGDAELVARLDDDIVLPPDWLAPLVTGLLRRPHAGCIGPKIINDDDTGSIQCGPYRHYPSHYGHDDEPDVGQADYTARTTHVRGCCNLYRRDVFARCGLMDVRYSPSQFDDPDHHIALLQAGFEILYEGRVRVVHKLNNGLARSPAAIANQRANQSKMRGKWGADVYEILERSLDLSREGRYLPDDWDTAEWLARGPAPSSYPRRHPRLRETMTGLIVPAYDELCATETAPAVTALIDEHLVLASLCRQNQAPRPAIEILHAAACLAPQRIEVLAALADGYSAVGQGALADLILRRARLLAPASPLLMAPVPNESAARPTLGLIARVNMIGENGVTVESPVAAPTAGGLRVLMVNTFENRLSGGDMHQIKKTRQYLQALGVHVDLCCTPRPDPRGYDVVHFWNTWFPAQTLAQIKAVRAWRPDVPVVLSPIFWDMSEKCWADLAVPQVFSQSASPALLAERLRQMAAGTLCVNGRTRSAAGEPNYRGYHAYQRGIFRLVDHLLPQSRAELENLKKVHGIEPPATLVHNGAETAVFDQATPDWFVQTHKVKDFVLIVGLVEPRKNQLMLLHALRDTGLTVVVVGRHYDHAYYQLCRKFAAPGTLFIDHLPHEQLASAFKAARVHALPSWMECAAFVNVEAALCGCALAVSDRTSEKEYFGADAYYCDPGNLDSIRAAVLSAHRNHAADAPKRARLADLFRTRFTWRQAAESTLAGYEAALASRRSAARAA